MYAVLTSLYDWGNRAAWAATALSIPFWLHVAQEYPKARLIAVQQRLDTTARESNAFCEKYGMPSGTRKHRLCVDDLMGFQAKQEHRITEEINDIF